MQKSPFMKNVYSTECSEHVTRSLTHIEHIGILMLVVFCSELDSTQSNLKNTKSHLTIDSPVGHAACVVDQILKYPIRP